MVGQLTLSLLALLVVGIAVEAHERPPRTLHEKTCVGLWMPAVHLHGVCIVDVTNRSNCAEVDRLFETENPVFDPIELGDLPYLLVKRALEAHALNASGPRHLCANVDTTFKEPETGCSAGYYGYKGECYTATRRNVSFDEAKRECGSVHGDLVTEFTPDIIGLLEYLVQYYIKADVFTGYKQIDDLENNDLDVPEGTNVELDAESDRLQYVVQKARRGFVCVVKSGIRTQPLFQPVGLPATVDDLISHDLHPLPPVKPSVERYLVDLLQFYCVGNFSGDVQLPPVVLHRADLVDLDENMPWGCRFNGSLGNVITDLANPTHEPKELQKVCKSLVRLYRSYDKSQRVEYFSIHPQDKRILALASGPRYQSVPVGYCAAKKGDCGASIPLYNKNSKVVVCYLYKSNRDLNLELREQRPLRYVQVANRLEMLYTSRNYVDLDITVQEDPATHYHSTKPHRLGGVISPLLHKQLNYYCKRHSVPLYRVKDLLHKNEFLTIHVSEVKEYRKNRDHYTEEELLGYCTRVQGYCGATQPVHHYRLMNHRKDRHQDDAYYPVAQPFDEKVEHDIVCYVY